MRPRAPVLVVALDMGDGGLIRHWSARGQLPHLSAMISEGAWWDLETTAEALHTSTWPTFATGTLPGRHGVYYPYQPTPGRQLARHIGPDQYGESTFWKLADAQGCRCLVYDVPETFPEAGFQGRAIFDWGTWAWYGKPATQPAALAGTLRSRFGPYPLGFEAKRLGLNHPDHLEPRLLRSIDYKRETAVWLLGEHPWDLAVIGFCETHPAGHYLWPAGADRVSDEARFASLLNVYAAIDRAIGALRDQLPPDAAVLIVSGDGVRASRSAWHLLPAVLERLGYLANASGSGRPGAEPSETSPAPPSPSGRSSLASLKRFVASRLPWQMRDRLGTWLQTRRIDWSRTRAFTLPTDLEGCIRVNLKGREPYGIVEPGQAYRDLCQDLAARLAELVNPATGRPAVERVWLRHEVFPGARQEELPDIMVTWSDEAALVGLQSPGIGILTGPNPDDRPGTHSSTAFLLGAGGGIQRGSYRGHLVDIAPTVLTRLGVSPIAGLDGRPLDGTMGRPAALPATPPAPSR
jgi:predicted AlkP superfamily phosphohydrolase/phosphomutase